MLGLMIWFQVGCFRSEPLSSMIDAASFSSTGETLFKSTGTVSLKEVHLGNLAGRDVVIEGSVVEFGQYNTFLVMADDSAHLLVVLTNIPDEAARLSTQQNKRIRVLGTIEHGLKGLPIMTARAIQTDIAPSLDKARG